MDSPPLSKLMGNVDLADESFGDMSLPLDSPAPLRTRPGQGTGFGSLLNRKPPTRHFEETPEVTRTLSSKHDMPSSSTSESRSRKSIFGNPHPLSASNSFGTKRNQGDVSPEEHETGGEIREEEEEGDRTVMIEQEEEQTAAGRAAREERLKDSLYELRGINDTFEMFLGALESARGHNERLAKRVDETSTLLDDYTALLGQTAHTYKLLSNPEWTGAGDDARALAAAKEAEEAARLEAIRKEEEAHRLAQEEQERKEEAARAREAAAAKPAVRGKGPPTRGASASTRGRGSSIPAPTTRTVSGGKPPPSVRQAPSGLGLAGQYANVKSSGYGPSRKAT